MLRRSVAVLAIIASLFTAPCAWGWGGPHRTITEAALATLPDWQRETLGDQCKPLGELYCCIPDLVYARKDLAPYAMMDSQPGKVYLVGLHLPGTPTKNYEMLRYFFGRAVTSLRAGNATDAACYAGTLAHMLEDWGCPAHAVPGDNMFTLFKQFLPPPADFEYKLLHGPMENGTFTLDLGDYQPRLLGTSVDEAAFHLLRRSQEATVYARGQVIPIIQALYAEDADASDAAQQEAALLDARLVADAFYTLVCLGGQRIDPEEAASLKNVDLSTFAPLEAPDLYMPQSNFFGKPNWGHATVGVILKDGQEPVPLRLRIEESGETVVKTFATGIGTGTSSTLRYLIPAGVYERFVVTVGLQVELGLNGNVTFEVLGDGRSLARVGPITGDVPGRPIEVALAGIKELQLTVKSSGGDGTGNYAVWAEPQVVKKDVR